MSLTPALYATWSPRLLGLLRIILGFLFLQHGTAKLFGAPHVAMFDGLQLLSVMGAAGVIELVGGSLLLVGLFTRPVAFILSGQMAAAYFIAHAPAGFLPILNGGEMAVMYCFTFLYFAAAGGGAYSLDGLRGKAGA